MILLLAGAIAFPAGEFTFLSFRVRVVITVILAALPTWAMLRWWAEEHRWRRRLVFAVAMAVAVVFWLITVPAWIVWVISKNMTNAQLRTFFRVISSVLLAAYVILWWQLLSGGGAVTGFSLIYLPGLALVIGLSFLFSLAAYRLYVAFMRKEGRSP